MTKQKQKNTKKKKKKKKQQETATYDTTEVCKKMKCNRGTAMEW